MKASDYIVEFFEKKGIKVIFGYIGGMITHLVDSIDRNPNVQFVQTYHEQTAAIASEGYAIESGLPGVAISTSGPGATNLMTGIADAYFGSIPVIFITGQVNSYEYKYNKPIRQQGFQETDVVSIVKPITKYSVLIDNASKLCFELEKAYHIAMSDRKGPVLLDITMDVTRTDIDPNSCLHYTPKQPIINAIDWDAIIGAIDKAERPMMLIGGGCQGLESELNSLLKQWHLPIVTSLMGRGIIDEINSNYIGMIGSYGNRDANMAISQCDLLIALGTRLDTRQTGAKLDGFIPNATIIHVDIDENELINHRLQNRICVNSDARRFIVELFRQKFNMHIDSSWLNWIYRIKKDYNQDIEIERFVTNKSPYKFFQVFNEISEENAIITADIGQNQMWAAQTIRLKKGQKFVTSGGLAPMGFSLPAAIGIAFANRKKTIYCFNGDGGFHMACQSLLLISQYGLNIKVIVMNNEALGMITQFQHLYFNDRMAATTSCGGYLIPDVQAMAVAYNVPYKSLTPSTLSKHTLVDCFKSRNLILDYQMVGLTSVYPKLEYNQPIYNPSPHLTQSELDSAINL